MKKTLHAAALASGVIASALVLAGCAAQGGTGAEPGTSATASTGATAEFNAADEMFVTMMIPHHEQAIEMADLILSKDGIEPRVTEVAEQIKDEQGPEIQRMRGWLHDWDVEYDESMSGMDHGGGMMSGDDMAALEEAEGTEASRLFLEQMIAHHQGAVEMAQSEVESGLHPDVIALAEQVAADQTAEIATMQELLASL